MTNLFWFKPVFMFELILAESMFLSKLSIRKGFAWRLLLSLSVCFAVAFLLPSDIQTGLYYSFLFLGMFFVTFLMAIFCYKASLKDILFCVIVGYTIQHIASEVYEIFNAAMESFTNKSMNFYETSGIASISSENYFFLVVYSGIFVLVYGVSFLFIVPKVEKYKTFEASSASMLFLSSFIVLIDVIIGCVVMSIIPFKALTSFNPSIKFWIYFLLHFYNIACCVLAIILLVEIPRRSLAEGELLTAERLYSLEKEQYKSIKDNLEYINIKCHDLKHQMRALLNGKQVDKQEIQKMENAIDIYDLTYKTKNEALNVVLMEKGTICKNEGIEFTCIIDGSCLSFIKDYDIYALFGNILDNAIEALRLVKNEKRVLTLQIKTRGKFVMIKSYNKYVGDLRFENGLPITTKADKKNHGYGLKSIRYVVKKYHGQLRIKADNNIYDMTILFQSSN